MMLPKRFKDAAAPVALACLLGAPAFAQDHSGHMNHDGGGADPHAAHKAQMKSDAPAEVSAAEVTINDVTLVDQTGRKGLLKSDFIGERVVVFDFIFTTCTTICPVTTSILAATKSNLSDLSDDDYVFVSVSIDPNHDGPAELAQFAEGRGADWTFLTGEKRVVDQVLRDLGSYSTNPEDHSAMTIIGDTRTGEFIRSFGLPRPAFVEAEVRKRVAAHNHAAHGGHS